MFEEIALTVLSSENLIRNDFENLIKIKSVRNVFIEGQKRK